jgi:GNAT superfamily N-acetyltransferase
MSRVPLGRIAYARSGDKGAGANVGVIAYTAVGYEVLRRELTADVVLRAFRSLGATRAERFELPNLGALNFVLPDVLGAGGSRSLRNDAQGKALGQALLEELVEVADEALAACLQPQSRGRREGGLRGPAE